MTDRIYQKSIVATGRGSDYYGPCDQCGTRMSEAFKVVVQEKLTRTDGSFFWTAPHASAYGHKECLTRFGPFAESIA